MTMPKRIDAFDPSYFELFQRAAAGETFRLVCESRGKAVYLVLRLRMFRKLLLEIPTNDPRYINAVSDAKLIEVAREDNFAIVRPVGGTWSSKVVLEALKEGKPARAVGKKAPDPIIPPEDKPENPYF